MAAIPYATMPDSLVVKDPNVGQRLRPRHRDHTADLRIPMMITPTLMGENTVQINDCSLPLCPDELNACPPPQGVEIKYKYAHSVLKFPPPSPSSYAA